MGCDQGMMTSRSDYQRRAVFAHPKGQRRSPSIRPMRGSATCEHQAPPGTVGPSSGQNVMRCNVHTKAQRPEIVTKGFGRPKT